MYLATEIEFGLPSLNSWCEDLAGSLKGTASPARMLHCHPMSHCLWGDIRLHDQLHPPGVTPRKVMQRSHLDFTKYVTLYFRQSAPRKMVRYDAA